MNLAKPRKSKTSTPSSPAPEGTKPKPRGGGRTWVVWSGVAIGAVSLLLASTAAYAYTSQSRSIIKSTTVAGIDVGGLKTSEALAVVRTAWTAYQKQPIVFTAGGKELSLEILGVGRTESEIVAPVVDLDPLTAVNAAAAFGHRGPVLQQVRERLSGWLGRRHELGGLRISAGTIAEFLEEHLSDQATQPVNASIKFNDDETAVSEGKPGRRYDTSAALRTAVRQAESLTHATIPVQSTIVEPDIDRNAALEALANANVSEILARAPIQMTAGGVKLSISKTQLKKLLGFYRDDETNDILVGLDASKTIAYLESLRPQVDQDAREARFEIVGGKIKAFDTSQVGRKLNAEKSWTALNNFLDSEAKTAVLVVETVKPLSESVGQNSLGITELVAEGVTNFRGSPTNRKYNLSYGAKLLNGLLIKPGDTFSLVKALGPIDAKHGWKPELVIKGARITPEFGGGLCQVATTLFRAALNAGLPIVERQNHSLRISYYEPPIGLDATIYEPKPDLRFTNDYATHLLLQTEVVGTLLKFRFYGTQDGRKVNIPTPKVYNRVPIPPTTTIETTDLKPGVKQCQAPGHPGADATATYTVTKSDGTKKTQVFQSHYRAIGVICRVGKKATSPKPNKNTNSNRNVNSAPGNVNASANRAENDNSSPPDGVN